MGLIQSSKGRFDSTLTDVMNDIRQPVFIDNAVHYAKSEPRSTGKTRVTIEAVNADNYDLATERTYSISETESSLVLTHSETDGHTLKSDIWSNRGKNSVPSLLYGKEDNTKRIMRSTMTSTDNGLRLDLRNMKGKTLKELGFDDTEIRLGQNIDVGFRTTDLAMRVSDAVNDTLTAISIGSPISITKMSSNRRKSSNTYLAADFNGVNLVTALRYISRHDNRIIKFDRYGVLNYVPFNFTDTSRIVESEIRFGSKDTSPIENVENRITVQGIPLAVNEKLVYTMDDRAKQQGTYDIDVIENTSPLFDASITNLNRAKAVARQILRANSTLSGSIKSHGHPHVWELRPGDIVEYDGNRLSVLEARHRLDGLTDFVLLGADSGLEGVLQNIREGSITSSSVDRPDNANQIISESFSFFDSMEVVITPTIKVLSLNSSGYLIGQNSERGRLGGNYKTIGMAKDDGIEIRGES